MLKVYHSEKEKKTPSHTPGAYETDQKTYLKFAAPDGYIHVTELQLEGKKKMKIEDFLRGFRPTPNPAP
jgi:methionyl-tRNA formyltransferase